MSDAVTLKMALPKIPDIELVAIEGLDRLARHLGIQEGKIAEARIIVTEAIINALEHSGDMSPEVAVEFTMTTTELSVHVKDSGRGFSPESVEEPDIRAKLASPNKRGWGLRLMKSMSDDFRITSDSRGTTITIRKLLR
ncbi:MAG TPA: ATP-binding protein [Bacteroidota bacterium]|nr:ATP-binding protein [Bacteroidota bacterium]